MKTKFISMMIGLTVLVGIRAAFAQVANPGIAPAGAQSIIYWPANGTTNYVLQTTTDLGTPNWTMASNAVTVNAVVVTNASPSGYFRLSESTPPAGMALIPAGSFLMGNHIINSFYNSSTNDPDITDANPTNVYVSAFYMDVNLVSSNLWRAVYSYATNNSFNFNHPGLAKGSNQPVETVDWFDCVKWSNERSQQAGLTPVYYTDAAFTQVFTNGDSGTTIYLNLANNGYRLPTEAEWEKAARGGLTGNRFPWGNVISESQADYYGDPSVYDYDLATNGYNTEFMEGGVPYTSPVGSFAPNGYGLYDMAGNVMEWCWDWYAVQYGQPTTSNPTGPATGSYRVLRGGSWTSSASIARCAYRYSNPGTIPSIATDEIGFRCAKGF
jgi:formylglycine-generating enzyme